VTTSPLAVFFHPRSVAVIGASDDATRIGGRTIWNLKEGGFSGPVYPINPNRAMVQGLAAYKALTDVPGDVDLVVFALPVEHVLPAMEQAVAKGVRAAVIFSAGFNEAGPEGVVTPQRRRCCLR
jgi:acyl-CoA synthetase (NDP forming)